MNKLIQTDIDNLKADCQKELQDLYKKFEFFESRAKEISKEIERSLPFPLGSIMDFDGTPTVATDVSCDNLRRMIQDDHSFSFEFKLYFMQFESLRWGDLVPRSLWPKWKKLQLSEIHRLKPIEDKDLLNIFRDLKEKSDLCSAMSSVGFPIMCLYYELKNLLKDSVEYVHFEPKNSDHISELEINISKIPVIIEFNNTWKIKISYKRSNKIIHLIDMDIRCSMNDKNAQFWISISQLPN